MVSNKLAAFLVALAGAHAAVAASDRPLRAGERFPSLVLPSLGGGEPLSIADFRGERLVLHVFGSW